MLNRPPTTHSTQRRFEPNAAQLTTAAAFTYRARPLRRWQAGPAPRHPGATLTPPRHHLPRALADAQSKSGAPAAGLAVAACPVPPRCIQAVRVSQAAPPYLKPPPSPGGSPKP
jgi:hypothetical protein